MDFNSFEEQAEKLIPALPSSVSGAAYCIVSDLCPNYEPAPQSIHTITGKGGKQDITKLFIEDVVLKCIPESVHPPFNNTCDMRQVLSSLRICFLMPLAEREQIDALAGLCKLIIKYFECDPELPSHFAPTIEPRKRFRRCAACWRFFEDVDDRQSYCPEHSSDRRAGRARNLRRIAAGIQIDIDLPALPAMNEENNAVMIEQYISVCIKRFQMVPEGQSDDLAYQLTCDFLLGDGKAFSSALNVYAILQSSEVKFPRPSKQKVKVIQARKMLGDGHSKAAIARHFKVSRQAVSKALS